MELVGTAQKDNRPTVLHQINDAYPEAVGLTLKQGRRITRAEVSGRQQFALVNQSFL